MNMLNAKENTSSSSLKKKKTTQGRKKIEIKKIESLTSRQVTFSKRRVGLFNKASELCILTGAQVAIIVHSLGGRVFSFGHPSTASLIDHYLNGSEEPGNGGSYEARDNFASTGKVREYNRQYLDLCKELEVEKKRKEIIEAEKRAEGSGGGVLFWWDEPVESMDVEELEQYAAALEELIKNVTIRANELMHIQNFNCMPPPPIAALEGLPEHEMNACGMFGDTAGILNQTQESGGFDYSNCFMQINEGNYEVKCAAFGNGI